jgi:hypothetical protein
MSMLMIELVIPEVIQLR